MIPFVLGLVVAFSASLPSVSYWTNNQNQSVREQIANYTPQSSLVRGIIGSSGYFTSHLRLQRYEAVNSFDYTRVVGISLETFAVPGIRAGNYSTGVFDGVSSVSLKVQMTIHNLSTYVASSSGYQLSCLFLDDEFLPHNQNSSVATKSFSTSDGINIGYSTASGFSVGASLTVGATDSSSIADPVISCAPDANNDYQRSIRYTWTASFNLGHSAQARDYPFDFSPLLLVTAFPGYHPDWPEGTLGFYLDTVVTYRTDLSAGTIEVDSIQV